MVKCYLLIKLLPGLEAEALSRIRATSGVADVNVVFGQWDAVAVAEADNIHDLLRLVVSEVRAIQGVQDTSTLVQGLL